MRLGRKCDSMKFYGILVAAIAASVLISGCISSASLKNTECDGSCAECADPCKSAYDGGSCGDCKNHGNCSRSCGSGCGDHKNAGNCSGTCSSSECGDCKTETKPIAKPIFSAYAEFANGSTNGGLKNFDVCTPSADRIVMDISLTSHAVGCSSVGFGEIIVILLDESYNIIFRNVYTDDGSESIELPANGGSYILLVEGAGGGSGIKVICDVDVWAINPVAGGCGGCGGCPP